MLTLISLFSICAWGETVTLNFGGKTFPGDDKWSYSNFVYYNDLSHDNGTYSASTNGKTSGYVQYDTELSNVTNVKFYISKTTTNTNTSSYFKVEYSKDKEKWTEIGKSVTFDKVTKETWTEVSIDCSVNGYIRISYTGTSAVRLLDDITITYSTGEAKCSAPTISPASGTVFSDKLEVSISCDEGDYIWYTTDGTDPSDSKTVIEYTAPFEINATTTVKAVAANSDAEFSDVVEATYTKLALTGDGTFENPYTVADVQLLKENKASVYGSGKAWVKGYIVGSAKSGKSLETDESNVDTNVALADDANSTTDFIPVKLDKNGNFQSLVGVASNSDNIGKSISVYGTLEDYFSVAGVKSITKVYGLNSLEIKFTEGYATYYTNCAFELPVGVVAGIVTAADTDKNSLTIDYKYETTDADDPAVVPANTGVLLKGEVKDYGYVVNTNSEMSSPSNNKLKGSVEEATTEGGDVYYMLSHNQSGENVGFYWGAAEGAAFTNGAHKAYLALTTSEASAAKSFSLDGGATGISSVDATATNSEAVYTLSGVQVKSDKLAKGIYVKNGKKFIVK